MNKLIIAWQTAEQQNKHSSEWNIEEYVGRLLLRERRSIDKALITWQKYNLENKYPGGETLLKSLRDTK